MTGLRILVVDDDWFLASLLGRILQGAGHRVVRVPDGRQALDLLARDAAFDTVLLDRQMPHLDGMEVLARMKATPGLWDIPVVFQTCMDSEAEILEGLRAGAHFYLVKPLDPKLVLQVVAAAGEEAAVRKTYRAEVECTRSAMGLVSRGFFRFQTLAQCCDLAPLLAKACPDPERRVLGLLELMINGLEHGNLGISYADKTALVEAHGWAAEVVRRQDLPENRDKWVTVSLVRNAALTRFTIRDQGPGFPWESFLDPDPARLFDSHGRGILLAKWEAFDRISYRGNGNCVVAEIDHV